jgi:O-succinylbenzoate synthase
MNWRVDRAEVRLVSMGLRSPFETSFGIEHDRHALIVRLLGEGAEGWGECVAGRSPGYSYETTGTARLLLDELLLPRLFSAPVRDAADFRERVANVRGHPLARASVELAIWDAIGRATNTSLSRLLGGSRPRVPVGVSVGLQTTPERLVEVVRDYREAGYRRVKIKIKPGRDRTEVDAVRRAFPDLPLQVDANSAYQLEDRSAIEGLDGFGLLMIEQPLAEDDLVDHGRLQAGLQTPICLDESILSARHARQALDLDAARVINIKPARVGGLLEAVAIHDLCFERNIPVWCGGMLETGIGRAANLALASLPGFVLPGDISASRRYYAEDLAQPLFDLNPDSTIDVPQGPGLGVEVDWPALDRATLRMDVVE